MQRGFRSRTGTAACLKQRKIRGRWRTAPALILDLGISVKVASSVHNLHRSEARLVKLAAVLFDWDCAGDAADVGHQILTDFIGQRLLQGDVADRQTTAGFQYPGDLSEDRRLF